VYLEGLTKLDDWKVAKDLLRLGLAVLVAGLGWLVRVYVS
jgi:hypothetical protein